MSRVIRARNKFVNSVIYPPEVYAPSKVKVIQSAKSITDYTKAKSLTEWLKIKYGISYKTFREKSKNKRAKLKEEYKNDIE